MKVIFMFDCPYHGLEYRLFCFRAFESKNDSLWKKFQLVELQISEEVYDYLQDLIQGVI